MKYFIALILLTASCSGDAGLRTPEVGEFVRVGVTGWSQTLAGEVVEIDGRTVVLQIPDNPGGEEMLKTFVINWDSVTFYLSEPSMKAQMGI